MKWRLHAPLLLLASLPGCTWGITNLMWNAQRSRPVAIDGAVLTREASVVADLDTTIGPLRVVKVADVSTDMMEVVDARGPLPPGRAITVRDGPFDSEDPDSYAGGPWLWLGPDGRHDGQLVLTVRSGGYLRERSIWYLRPIDFSRWQAWGAVVATPVTVAVDLVIIWPTEMLWTILTMGQHGPLYPFDDG
ncbi:MAG TPA: hypothetical protein VFY71_08700 [Planctomycetota bacterium]|nr:hypothetical protein [Planctomycetota bacterium]